jgi:hypothetical protein
MEFSFDKYISIVYRPDLLSSGLVSVLGKGRGLMRSLRLSQEDLWRAGILFADEGRDVKDVFTSDTGAFSPEESSHSS